MNDEQKGLLLKMGREMEERAYTADSATSEFYDDGARRGQIREQLTKLGMQLEELEKAVFGIDERLKDVLSGPLPQNEDMAKDPKALVPLAELLREKNNKLSDMIQYLNQMRQRVEL